MDLHGLLQGYLYFFFTFTLIYMYNFPAISFLADHRTMSTELACRVNRGTPCVIGMPRRYYDCSNYVDVCCYEEFIIWNSLPIPHCL
jgi:hypothetical protein